MKFFIPMATDPDQEARVYDAIKQHLVPGSGASSFSGRRVQHLEWHHDGKEYEATVGQVTTFNGELVIAILYDPASKLYHVCTPNRGVARGGSILAGAHDVLRAADFDEP